MRWAASPARRRCAGSRNTSAITASARRRRCRGGSATMRCSSRSRRFRRRAMSAPSSSSMAARRPAAARRSPRRSAATCCSKRSAATRRVACRSRKRWPKRRPIGGRRERTASAGARRAMTDSGLGLGRRELTLADKFRGIQWGLLLLLGLIAGIGFAMLYSAANGEFQPWASRQMIRFAIVLVADASRSALIDMRVLVPRRLLDLRGGAAAGGRGRSARHRRDGGAALDRSRLFCSCSRPKS